MAPHAKILIVSGNAASPAKVPFFPEHTKEDFAVDIARAPWLQVAPGFPRPCVYDFRRDHALLKHSIQGAEALSYVLKKGGTLGWSIVLGTSAHASSERARDDL